MLKKLLYLKDFLTKEIWSIKLTDFSPKKAMQIKVLRVVMLALRGIREDKIQQRAAALTLFTLLSIVPILALGFGIAKGFGLAKYLESVLRDKLSEYKDIVENLINFANTMLERTQGGLVAGVGLAVLIYTVMKVLINVESSFNDIWQVKKGRTYIRKFSDYVSMMLIAPVFLIVASGVNVFLTDRLQAMKSLEVVSFISPVLISTLKIIPFLLIIILFTLIYIVMPNTKVTLRAGAIGGIIAGAVFQIFQWFYIYIQIKVSNYNAIYGSFAAIPLFIIWLQWSWLILLFGAKISYATQNYEMYEFEIQTVHMSDYSRRILSLLVTHKIVQNFDKGLYPLTTIDLMQQLSIPIRMLKVILNDLVKCKLINEVITDKPKVVAFQPATNIEKITVKLVMEKIDKQGEHYSLDDHSEASKKFIDIHDRFFASLENMPENILIKDV
jgi:membrane protein